MADQGEPFEDYILYRYRINELVTLYRTLDHLSACPLVSPERRQQHVHVQQLAIAIHLHGFFDRGSDRLNAFDLWRRYFPIKTPLIEDWRNELAPAISKLRDIRHTAGAHANLRLTKQSHVRIWLFYGWSEIDGLCRRFYDCAREIAQAEETVPRLCESIADWGLHPSDLPFLVIPGEIPEGSALPEKDRT